DDEAVQQLRQAAGLGAPQPVLTLSPVLHQRRANRNVTEYRPEGGSAGGWSSAHQDEARELRAYDRIREEPARGKQQRRRPGKEVNGNVARPERPGGGFPRKNKRGVAPGQELPSVRTWFAGDSRDGGGARPAGGQGNKRRGGKPGANAAGARGGGHAGFANANPYAGFGGGQGAHGGSHGNEGRPGGNRQGGRGRPQGQGGNRPAHGGARPGGNRPHGRGGSGGGRSGNR
ncbi:MAG: pseudouridine synthase, partial [Xanthomonadaceae bacterium]|nr:pseudouridine synthase [Xanthomonadaceae bacterium]